MRFSGRGARRVQNSSGASSAGQSCRELFQIDGRGGIDGGLVIECARELRFCLVDLPLLGIERRPQLPVSVGRPLLWSARSCVRRVSTRAGLLVDARQLEPPRPAVVGDVRFGEEGLACKHHT